MATIFKRWLILAVALITAPGMVCAQSVVRWTSYKIADGLAEPVFDSVAFTPQGKLIASRLKAPLASELDGYSVSNFSAPAGLQGRICESPGGQCWALVPQGLVELKNDSWRLHPVTEISAVPPTGSPHAAGKLDFLPVRQGSVLILRPDSLLEFSAENPDAPRTIAIRPAAKSQLGEFTGMTVSRDESLWLSGVRGLARTSSQARHLDPNAAWQEYLPPVDLPLHDFTHPICGTEGRITVLAEAGEDRAKMVVTFDGHNWGTQPAGALNFFCAWCGAEDAIWAATTNSLYQWSAVRTNWVEHEEISAGQIFDVAVEPGGAFWLATADGLLRASLPLWSRPEPIRARDMPVNSVAAEPDGWIAFVAGGNLHRLRNEVQQEYPLPPALRQPAAAVALFALKNGSLLVAGDDTLFEFTPANGTFQELHLGQPGQPAYPLGVLPDGGVCLYQESEHHFDEFDGNHQPGPLANPPPVGNGEGSLATLFSAQTGDLWLAGERAVFWCHDGKWQRFVSQDHNVPESALGFAELKDGRMMRATADELWEFDGKSWEPSHARFNHINALTQTREGGIWLASNGGLFRFCNGIWLENGAEEGLPNNAVTALCEDSMGRLWAGSAHGLTVFNPQADLDPPRTSVQWLGGNASRLSEGDTLNLLFSGQDKWKITPRERLLYSYQVDQLGWSAFQDSTMVSFSEPTAGRRHIQVRAMDRNGNVDPLTATLEFTVFTPWFRELRLWVVLGFGVAAAVFFAAVALNRHRQLVRSHAAVEQKVAERTRELEIATRELMHSQKMNALGTLAAGIAHDFNNILSIIKGSAQIIEDNTDQPEKIRTRVSRIKTVVQQGAEIVDAMLGFGRTSDTAPAPCDINAIVADTVKLLGDRFLREVEVKIESADGLPQISAAREFVQQILLNFIFNAAEAMQGHKQIILSTRLANALPPEIVLPPSSSGSFILVSVQDPGTGIPPEIRARIFEPFFTTKAMSTRRGTGLGLSMVYELAKKMGAGLAVNSLVGQGSTFTLILPVLGEPLLKNPAPKPTETLRK